MDAVSKEPFYQYVEDVISEKEVVGKMIRQAVERFIKDCDRKDYVFDYKEGKRLINFAGLCHHWKGVKEGKPFELDPFQHFYLIQKYGWVNPNNGLQRFRRTYKQVGRKQAKTTELAIESLFHMTKGVDDSGQIWVCANKEDDAIIVVNDTGRIAQASPRLKDKFKYLTRDPYVRRVIYPARNSFMAYMTKGQDAVDTSMGIGDECHEWKNANVMNRIASSMGNRLCPTFTVVTTAGFDKFGYCYQTLRDKGKKILEGSIIDDEQLIVIYELDEDDNWEDEKLWIKANPLMHSSITVLPYLKSEFTKAKNNGGTDEVNFKTKNLNLWTDASTVWIKDENLMKSIPGINPEQLKGMECWGGLYSASKESLNSFVIYFPEVTQRNGTVITALLIWSWLPEAYIDKNSDNMDYRHMIESGHVKVTPGNEADHRIISKDVIEIWNQYTFNCVGFDKTFGQYVAPDLENEGIPVMEINQSFNNLAQQTAEIEKMIGAGRLEWFQNPVFRWHLGNTVTHKNSQGVTKPDSQASGSRIGSVSAALNAMACKFLKQNEVMNDFKFK